MSVVFYCAAVMLFCRVAVNSNIAALQHHKTATQRMIPGVFPLAGQDLDILIDSANRSE